MQESRIDKLAYIYIQNKKVLMSLSHNKGTWYISGSKRKSGESDYAALIREVKEELSVELVPETIRQYGVFEAQAHGRSKGTLVRMTCCNADFIGELAAASEIERIDFFAYSQKSQTGPVDFLIFDDLHRRRLLM